MDLILKISEIYLLFFGMAIFLIYIGLSAIPLLFGLNILIAQLKREKWLKIIATVVECKKIPIDQSEDEDTYKVDLKCQYLINGIAYISQVENNVGSDGEAADKQVMHYLTSRTAEVLVNPQNLEQSTLLEISHFRMSLGLGMILVGLCLIIFFVVAFQSR